MPLSENTEGTHFRTVVWRNRANQGNDYCSLWQQTHGWLLRGTAITFLEDGRPMLAEYEIGCDRLWHTRHVTVERVIGSKKDSVDLTVDSSGAWYSSGEQLPALRECVDIDLAVTPATNTLPIRRLNLEVGESRGVAAAWLKFPELTLEILPQRYTHRYMGRYFYESSSGFSAELLVDDLGLVVSYPDGWEQMASL